MNLDYVKQLVQNVVAEGKTPLTILMPVDTARELGLPSWTRTLFGLKLVIGYNIEALKVVPFLYQTVLTKKSEEENLKPIKLFEVN